MLVVRVVDDDQRLEDVPLLFRLELSIMVQLVLRLHRNLLGFHGLLYFVMFCQCSLELDVAAIGSADSGSAGPLPSLIR